MSAAPSARLIADTARFYDILARLEERLGGRRALAECNGRMAWPAHGVYFLFEAGERRSASGDGDRVVRVGTHALTARSRTTLWQRLSQHRGTARTPGGNHRGSVFRLLVGIALAQRGDCRLPSSWGVGHGRGRAAQDLGITSAAVKDAEADLEARVSAYLGRMQVLWLEVPDAPGPGSARGRLERNAIALLSHARRAGADAPSTQWLGRHSDRPRVRASGLWNNNHVDECCETHWLDAFADLVERSR